LVSENLLVSPHYLIIFLAIIVGLMSHFFFSRTRYSIIMGLLLSLIIAVPFYFIELRLPVVILIFLYTCWRMHANFGLKRLGRWNFLAINTIVFTIFYFITRSYLQKAHAIEINKVNVLLFLITTALFIIIRYLTTLTLGRRMVAFDRKETSLVFAVIFGVGTITYLIVYFLIEPVRTGILAGLGFLFGGIFMFIAAFITPFLDYIIDWLDYLRWKSYQEMEPPILNFDDDADEKMEILTSSTELDIWIYVVLGGVILAAILLFMIFRKKQHNYEELYGHSYKVRFFGRQNSENENRKHVYDYSAASNAVRTAFQVFENDANQAQYPRFAEETVKEWFSRMGWGNSHKLFVTYDKARYSSMTLTEEEGKKFVDYLNKIRDEHFSTLGDRR